MDQFYSVHALLQSTKWISSKTSACNDPCSRVHFWKQQHWKTTENGTTIMKMEQ